MRSARIIFGILLFEVILGLSFSCQKAFAGTDYDITDPASYDVSYTGNIGGYMAAGAMIATGDVNGDGISDLVVDDYTAKIFVIFGGSTSGDLNLSDSNNYNIVYTGLSDFNYNIHIGDVNGDNLGDLVLNNATTVYVIFSTLIDDHGSDTGQSYNLSSDSTKYNIKYTGVSRSSSSYEDPLVTIGDINGDGLGDLVLGSNSSTLGGAGTGSIFVIFSTRIDDNSGDTNQNYNLSSDTSRYNIRYDGGGSDASILGFIGEAIRIADVNGDGRSDLITGCDACNSYYELPAGTMYKGSVIVVFSTLIDDVGVSTGITKVLSTGSNYNLRIDGANYTDNLSSSGGLEVGDVNGDGVSDILAASPAADFNGNGSGSVYLIFSTIIDDFTTTGNVVDLTDNNGSSYYNLRLDGPYATNFFPGAGSIITADFDGDGDSDLAVADNYATTPGASNSGSVFILFSNFIVSSGAAKGQELALNNSSSFNVRIDGARANDYLTYSGGYRDEMRASDFDGDGGYDLVIFAQYADVGSNSNAGAVYLISSQILSNYTQTQGDYLDLGNSNNYTTKYYGPTANKYLARERSSYVGDVNADGVSDLIIGYPDMIKLYIIYTPDSTPPTGSISVNSGSTYSNSTSVTLTLSATDNIDDPADIDMKISEDAAFTGASYENYVASKAFTLSAGDGTKTVYVKFKDTGSNESTTYSDTIILDTTAPTGEMSINSGDKYTNSREVTISISATDTLSGMGQMMLSSDSSLTGGTYVAYSASKSFELDDSEGKRTVYIKFKDVAGNESTIYSDFITLDTEKPTGKFSINASNKSADGPGAKSTTNQSTTLYIEAEDETSGVESMKVSEDSNFDNASWVDYATSKTFDLSQDLGNKTVYLKFKDEAGNESDKYSQGIELKKAGIIGGILPPILPPIFPPGNGGGTTTEDKKGPKDKKDSLEERAKPAEQISSYQAITQKSGRIVAVLPLLAQTAVAALGYVSIFPHISIDALPAFLAQLFRKKKNPWGVVYDYETKEPLDPVIVTLKNSKGVVSQTITDMFGRYEFLAEPGQYLLTVGKSSYEFPSKKVKSDPITGKFIDPLYEDVYLGGKFLLGKNEKIAFNIPMDQIGSDWNEAEKARKKWLSQKTIELIYKIINVVFIIGLVANLIILIMSPTLENVLSVMLYGVILLIRALARANKGWGLVLKNGEPQKGLVLTLENPEIPQLKYPPLITKNDGRYSFLVEKGKYQIKVKEMNTLRDITTLKPITIAKNVDIIREDIILPAS